MLPHGQQCKTLFMTGPFFLQGLIVEELGFIQSLSFMEPPGNKKMWRNKKRGALLWNGEIAVRGRSSSDGGEHATLENSEL